MSGPVNISRSCRVFRWNAETPAPVPPGADAFPARTPSPRGRRAAGAARHERSVPAGQPAAASVRAAGRASPPSPGCAWPAPADCCPLLTGSGTNR